MEAACKTLQVGAPGEAAELLQPFQRLVASLAWPIDGFPCMGLHLLPSIS